MDWNKYFILGEANTQNPNPGDVLIKDGVKYLITRADPGLPIFCDVSPFGRDERVWNLVMKEADYLMIAGRPRLGLFAVKLHCDYYFWKDVMAAKASGIVTADLWAGSGFPGWDVNRALELFDRDPTLAEVIGYESQLDYVVVRDSLAYQTLARKSVQADLLPCSTCWAPDWYGIEPHEKTINAVVLRAMPSHPWVLDRCIKWHRQLLDDKPTFFLAHGTPDYEWFLERHGPDERLMCIYDPRSLLEFYARVDKMVSFRVHGTIPALTLGARVFHVATDIRSLSVRELGVEPVYYTEFETTRGELSESDFARGTLDKARAEARFVEAFRAKVLSRRRARRS